MISAMLHEAWRAMGANRLRTLLTMLGMVIGVGAVVLMMAIGQGAQYAVAQTISSMGSNIFVVLSGYTSAGGVRSGSGNAPTLNVADANAIAELDGVDTVAPVHWGSVQMVHGSNNWNAWVQGTTPAYLDARSWPLAEGAAFTDSDVRAATRVALVGRTVAQNLFGDENPVNKTFRIGQAPFVVLGVLAPKGQNLDGRDQDDLVIMGTLPESMDLEAEFFLDNPIVVVAPPDHPLVGKKSIPLARLAEERFISREPGSGTRAARTRLFAEHGVTIEPYMELGSSEAIKQAVMAGLGISVLSRHNLRLELEAGLIAVLDVEHFPLMRQWYAVHLKGKKLSSTARKFLDFLLQDGARYWNEEQARGGYGTPPPKRPRKKKA